MVTDLITPLDMEESLTTAQQLCLMLSIYKATSPSDCGLKNKKPKSFRIEELQRTM